MMKGYPSSTNVETVNDGAESAMFTQLFQKWSVRQQTVGLASPNLFSAAKVFHDKFDVTLLHAKPAVAAQERMVDDGNGKVEVSPVTPSSQQVALALLAALLQRRWQVSPLLSSSPLAPWEGSLGGIQVRSFPTFFRDVKGRSLGCYQ